MNVVEAKAAENVVDGGVEKPAVFALGASESRVLERRSDPSPGLAWKDFDETYVADFWHRFHVANNVKRVVQKEEQKQWLGKGSEED